MSGDTLADSLLIASRLVWYAGLLGVIGASAFRLFVSSGARGSAELHGAAATTGFLAAAILLCGVLARLYAQAYVSFGLEEPVTLDLLFDVATGLPPWSTGWLLQVAAALVSLIALGAARAGHRLAWAAAHGAAVGLAAAAPFTGHAIAQADWYALPIVLHAVHVLAAGVWIGGLFVLLVVGIAGARGRAALHTHAVAPLVNAFSPLGLAGAGLLAGTGLLMAFLYLQALADLWATAYGRTLALKVALFGAVAAAGFVNWRRVRPRLTAAGGAERLRRTATIELILAAGVIAATALLVGLPQPGE